MRFGAMDHPDGDRKLHPRATPLWGGLSVLCALVLGVVLVEPSLLFTDGAAHLMPSALVLLAAAGICLFGAVDDVWPIRSRPKLLLQVFVLSLVVGLGFRVEQVNLLNHTISLGWLAYPITLFWLLGCVNAFNLLDGSDGLVTTVAMVASGLIAVVASVMGHHDVALLAAAMVGATAGFLVHNRPTARIFLGDSGSMLIGLVVGMLSLKAAIVPDKGLVVVFPIVLICLPLLDSVLALLRRLLSGKSFDTPDREHIHHRLGDRGFGAWRVLITLSVLFTVTGAAATIAFLTGYRAIGWMAAITTVVWMVRAQWFGHHEWEMAARTVHRWTRRAGSTIGKHMVRHIAVHKKDGTEEDKKKKPPASRRKAA